MLTPSLNTVMTRLLIVAAVLATLIVFLLPSTFAQADETVMFKENSEKAVRTFMSTDPEIPEMMGVVWDVTGTDADLFQIDTRGMLTFKSPPDFEDAKDKAYDIDGNGALNDDNEPAGSNYYHVIVRASEVKSDDYEGRALYSETKVTVVVENVDEDGSTTLNRLQPEVGTPITAVVSDPDGTPDVDDITFQWYVSKVSSPEVDVDDHWVSVPTPATDPETFTPRGVNAVDGTGTAQDEGKFLRAVAIYTDGFRESPATTTAMGISMYAVRKEVTSDSDENVENPENGSPGFSTRDDDYKRSILESTGVGMPVGARVQAIDPNGDTLTYELDDDIDDNNDVDNDEDVGFFSIDMASGQISLKKMLSHEATDGREYDAATDPPAAGTYKFYVRAIDPSGETALHMVTVTADDANDSPMILASMAPNSDGEFDTPIADFGAAPSELRVMEKDDDDDSYNGSPGLMVEAEHGNDNVFVAWDQDARHEIDWELRGKDADDFEISSTSPVPTTGLRGPGEPVTLRFKEAPDFEDPTDSNFDSVYKVTLVATDNRGAEDERPLTVFVDNVAEKGSVELVTAEEGQPQIGDEVTAMVDDPDNGVAVVTWQWLKSATGAADSYTVIPGATMGTYTPVDDDNGYYLQVKVTYTDMTSDMDDSITVNVDERSQDAADAGQEDSDAEAKTPSMVDGEEENAPSKLFRVMATSENAIRVPRGERETVDPPEFAMATVERSVYENAETGSLVGYPVRVMPEKGKSFTYNLDATVTGDEKYFMIDDYGQIRVMAVPVPARTPADQIAAPANSNAATATGTDPVLDFESGKTYSVIVTAEQVGNTSRTAMATVNISTMDVNEVPYFDKASRENAIAADTDNAIPYAEMRTNAIVQFAGVEPDGDSLRWEVTGADAGLFMVMNVDDINDGKDRRELRFKDQPNFEGAKDSAGDTNRDGTVSGTTEVAEDNYYHVTVRATEESAVGGGPNMAATLDFTVQVTNSAEGGMVEIDLLQPEVGTPLLPTATDDDVVAGTPSAWQWYRAKVDVPATPSTDPAKLGREWESLGTDGDDREYTPVEADEEKFLLVRAVYTDGFTPAGATTAAVGMSAYKVRKMVSDEDNNSPDFNASSVMRTIPEDTAVGDPVGAPVTVIRNEDDDVLTYSLVMTRDDEGQNIFKEPNNPAVVEDDLPFFAIDKRTGQITVEKRVSAEMTDGRNYDDATDPAHKVGQYVLVVRATDPAGEGAESRDEVVVNITVTNVNEAPGVTGMAELSVNENSDDKDVDYIGLGMTPGDPPAENMDNLYKRTEDDVTDTTDWDIGGPDGAYFEYDTPDDGIGRTLHFITPPDYENPLDANRDNVYEVTIMVEDTGGLTGEKSVRVTVMNLNEEGKLELSPEQPDDGMPVIATLTDPDGVVIVTDWQWATTTDSTLEAFPDGSVVMGATMAEHTGNVGEFLWAMVDYRDGASIVDDPVTAADERNYDSAGAEIPTDGDTDEMLSKGTDNAVQPDPDPTDEEEEGSSGVETFTRMVYENVPSTGYVGDPIMDLGPRDEIGGPDGATFVFAESNDSVTPASTFYDADLRGPEADDGADVNDKMGQLALAPVTHLDAEGSKIEYTIEITDPDAETEISTYRITIMVMNVNEPPSAPAELKGLPQPLNTPPMFDMASTTMMVAENSAAGTVVGMVMATDADRGDSLTYTLGGDHAMYFDIDDMTGEITVGEGAMLDYESDMMYYMVDVMATDEEGEMATIMVTIMVTNVGLDNMYDMDDSGKIEIGEAITAVQDFFGGRATLTDAIATVQLYFAGLGG